jgi:hypothetical protein
MKESEAVRITATLNSLFPRDALDPKAAAAFAQEIALLVNAEIGMEAAHVCARDFERFPSIHTFRVVYHSVQRGSTPPPALDETVVDPATRDEVGKMIAEALHRMESPTEEEVPGGVAIEDLGKGVCADCGYEGNTWTYGETDRPLCSRCIRARLRVMKATASRA